MRAIDRLSAEEFDVVVIGAGIHGACAAYEASRRGLKTALLEAGDYCSATSANSLKIVHGGLRYLQNFDIRRMRESIRERRAYQQLAPHLVHPLPCVLPTFGNTTKSRQALFAALILNDLISMDRNKGISREEKKLPSGKTVNRQQLQELVPYLETDGFSGAAHWYDAQLQNSERFVLAFIKAAIACGAACSNYCQVTGIQSQDGSVTAVEAVDGQTGATLEIGCRSVINASGAGYNSVLQSAGVEPDGHYQPSIAINLIFDMELPGGCAAGLRNVFNHGGRTWSRILFYTPWRNKLLVGTRHLPVNNEAELRGITESQIAGFIENLQKTTPALELTREKLSWWHWGVIPMQGINSKNGEVDLLKHQRIIDHAGQGLAGLTSIIGVKYTTGRLVAEQAVLQHAEKNNLQLQAGSLPLEPLPGSAEQLQQEGTRVLQDSMGMSAEQAGRHRDIFGDEVAHIGELLTSESRLAAEIPAGDGLSAAAVVHSVRNEAAVHLDDLMLRRTGLGSAGEPAPETTEAVIGLMAAELGWNESQTDNERQRLAAHYQTLPQ